MCSQEVKVLLFSIIQLLMVDILIMTEYTIYHIYIPYFIYLFNM